MSNSLRAALLSGLVFPGLGQIILKHYRRGVVLMLTVLACLSAVIVKAVQQGLAILNQIQSDGGEISMGTISNAAQQVSITSYGSMINIVLLVIVSFWIIGILGTIPFLVIELYRTFIIYRDSGKLETLSTFLFDYLTMTFVLIGFIDKLFGKTVKR